MVRIMPSSHQEKDAHILIPRISEYVRLHGKRDFANVIKFIDLDVRRFSWITQGVQ